MKTATINTIIDDFNALQLEDKEFAIDIIRKAAKAVENMKKGKVKRGTIKDLYKDLENGCLATSVV